MQEFRRRMTMAYAWCMIAVGVATVVYEWAAVTPLDRAIMFIGLGVAVATLWTAWSGRTIAAMVLLCATSLALLAWTTLCLPNTEMTPLYLLFPAMMATIVLQDWRWSMVGNGLLLTAAVTLRALHYYFYEADFTQTTALMFDTTAIFILGMVLTGLHRLRSDKDRLLLKDALHANQVLVLDAVDQGLAVLDREQRVVDGISASMASWFPTIAPGQLMSDVFEQLDPTFAGWFDQAFEQLASDVLPWEVAVTVFPQRLEHSGHILGIELRPIGGEETWRTVLLVISDISADVERERAEEHRSDLAAMVQFAARDSSGFAAFIEEARNQVHEVRDSPPQEGLRILHTLKGNASAAGLGSVARLAHDLEGRLADDAASWDGYDVLAERVEAVALAMAPLLDRHRDAVVIGAGDLEELVEAIRAKHPVERLVATVDRWRLVRLAALLDRTATQARGIAARMGKHHVSVVVEHDDSRVDGDAFRGLFAALVHALRNALDHGVESPEQRERAGKPATATVRLKGELRDGQLVVQVEDDGAGIDWEAVAARAQEAGMPHATDQNLLDALFASGLSTREQADEISGRGIGLAALWHAAQELHGELDVRSKAGKSTTITCRVAATDSEHGRPQRTV